MKKPTKIYDSFDIVVVPFPFIDTTASKRRPALILSASHSFNTQIQAYVMAMITTATHSPWPLDTEIEDLQAAGLPIQSIIRMKLFTLEHKLILKHIGTLGKIDQKHVSENLKALFTMKPRLVS